VDRGLESIDDHTTFLFPDGSYTQGASAYLDCRIYRMSSRRET
jgi:hypothetical protein